MNKPAEHAVIGGTDSIQALLTDYACKLRYEDLSPAAAHAGKVRIIDTLGALVGGYFGECCQLARNIAARTPWRPSQRRAGAHPGGG